jgi:radical SAM superfamily enzyme YgiQ (UPF0313 family)
VAASIHGKFDYAIVDGNLEPDPWAAIRKYLETGQYRYFGLTVMPGPQLSQAIPITQQIKSEFPEVCTIWGGYFASNQYRVVIQSPFVDFVVHGPGDNAFPELLDALEHDRSPENIRNLIYLEDGKILRTPAEELLDQNVLPPLPYTALERFYPLQNYLGKTFLGTRTIAYHSSVGCPFTCSFCAVVPIYKARWKGKSAEKVYRDIQWLKDTYGADAIEFHDNNFFVSEKRTVEFARLIKKDKMQWWGEGRIDTLDKYSDESLAEMRDAGCRMIFFGAETSSDDILSKMDKGGTQTAEQIKRFAGRLRQFNIIPEYSFVLGMPGESDAEVMEQIEKDIAFIKEVKTINPDTEIIIYIYSPVATEGSELYDTVKNAGFAFPEKLEDWLQPQWENFDLRKNPLTPWLKPYMVDRIRNFETVLNAYYPTASDFRLTPFKRRLLRVTSAARYKWNMYGFPYELKFFQKVWKYRQPEIEGFLAE